MATDPECKSITSCKSIERIIKVLQFHATNPSNDEVIKYFNRSYSNLLNDYSHILNIHNVEFELLYQYIIKYINCSIEHCKQYRRNNRIREKNNEKQYELDKYDKEGLFYINIMDTIHCLLLHSYDQGFRLNNDNINKIVDDEKKSNDSDSETLNHDDKYLNKMKQHLENKRKNLKEIGGYDRIENNKFMTDFSNDTIESVSKFNFGQRFYYWDYHKNNDEKDVWCNPGYSYGQFYVSPYYADFKEEITNILNISKYQDIVIKSEKYMKSSNYIKQLKSKDYKFITLQYGIKANSNIDIKHLLSIILYTDYTEISYNFSKSFRDIDKNESINSIKQRNSKYFFWSKYLRELVEGFGSDTFAQNTDIREFYHGTSYLLFPQMIAKFKGPTSTSSQLAVAVIFSSESNGIILSLKNRPSGVPVEFFNCQFLSAFSSEDEKLFFGGRVALQIHTIRLLNDNNIWENYSYFVKSLVSLDRAITGNASIGDGTKLTNTDYKIINKLIQQKINCEKTNCHKYIPNYITQLFKVFCNDRKMITIDLQYLNQHYPLLKKQLISTKNDNLLAFNNITKIYEQCQEIIIRKEYGSKVIDIDDNYLSLLLEEVSNISSLKVIKIISPNIEPSLIEQFKNKFKQKHWILEDICRVPYCGSDKLMLLCNRC